MIKKIYACRLLSSQTHSLPIVHPTSLPVAGHCYGSCACFAILILHEQHNLRGICRAAAPMWWYFLGT